MRWLLLVLATVTPLAAQIAAPNEAGISIGHIHLMVQNPDELKKLCVDLLGAQVVHAGTLELLKFPGVFLVVGKSQTAPSGGSEGSTVHHFGFRVHSYLEMHAKVQSLHMTFALDNVETRQFIARFPGPVNIEFTEDASVSGPAVFHHIHVSTPDQEKAREWYLKTFGARSGMRGIFPAAFIPGAEVDFRKAEHAESPTKGRSLDHIGFEVKNLETFCKKLQAAGVTLDVPYREIPQLDGLKIAFLTDPEGTRIELTEGLAGR